MMIIMIMAMIMVVVNDSDLYGRDYTGIVDG
jgi:hypothetical protein